MAAHVAAGRLPGLVTLVARGDDVHVDTVGTPSFTDHTPLARDGILFAQRAVTSPEPPPLMLDFWAGVNAAAHSA